jgi:hypothetical protein
MRSRRVEIVRTQALAAANAWSGVGTGEHAIYETVREAWIVREKRDGTMLSVETLPRPRG